MRNQIVLDLLIEQSDLLWKHTLISRTQNFLSSPVRPFIYNNNLFWTSTMDLFEQDLRDEEL